MSWVQFAALTNSDLSGALIWLKPAGASPKNYPSGFTNDVTAAGSLYTAPSTGLFGGSANLYLSDGGLTSGVSTTVTFDSRGKGTSSSLGSKFSLKVTLSSGLFQGSVKTATDGKVSFQGVLFEKGDVGAGYFSGKNNLDGGVYLSPSL